MNSFNVLIKISGNWLDKCSLGASNRQDNRRNCCSFLSQLQSAAFHSIMGPYRKRPYIQKSTIKHPTNAYDDILIWGRIQLKPSRKPILCGAALAQPTALTGRILFPIHMYAVGINFHRNRKRWNRRKPRSLWKWLWVGKSLHSWFCERLWLIGSGFSACSWKLFQSTTFVMGA